jgi:hypothetical protein
MAKRTIGSYNATIQAIRHSTGVSHREAQQAYRTAKVRLGHIPTPKDARSTAVRESARIAAKQISRASVEKQRAIEKIIERAQARRGRGGGILHPPAGGGADRGGGGGGGGGGVIKVAPPPEEYGDYYDLEPPDEIADEVGEDS